MLARSNRLGPIIPPKTYGNPQGVAVGAMRWNGVYSETTVLSQENGYLGPNKYHFRAPWWSVAGNNTINVQGSQATMDAEIDYAVAAKIGYWAFFYYGSSITDEMNQGFTYFQASSKRGLVNWCLAWASFGSFNTDVGGNLAYIISLVSQSNYQTVMGGRPLVYLYNDGNGTNSASQVASFRAACISAGLKNPYIVVMNGDYVAGNAIKTANALDAITCYAIQFNETTTYDALRSEVEAMWPKGSAISDLIPTVMLGWQPQPRGSTTYYDYPLPGQLSDHVQNAVNFAAANCPAKAVMCYAWNEHSEGGWLCPTYIDGTAADASHLNAVAAVLA